MGKKLIADKNLPIEEIKTITFLLAHLKNIQALHVLDKYSSTAPKDLKDWVVLAYQECLTFLECELKDEDQAFISTGLGGKNNMIRYYFVLSSSDKSNLTKDQKEIIKKSLEKIALKKASVVEEIAFKNNYALIQHLTSLDIAVGDFIETSINECNKTGNNFLIFHYYTTNVKKPNEKEILKYLEYIK